MLAIRVAALCWSLGRAQQEFLAVMLIFYSQRNVPPSGRSDRPVDCG
jgi:hypothetical protein